MLCLKFQCDGRKLVGWVRFVELSAASFIVSSLGKMCGVHVDGSL